jgi:hypothetical protein
MPVDRNHEQRPGDVLAAEEFVVPAPDPALHREPPHDVLAAEEFVVPAPDPVLRHHGPVALPGDPSGIAEPHDVLAAEEFALPAPTHARAPLWPEPRRRPARRATVTVAVGALAFLVARRIRRKRRS